MRARRSVAAALSLLASIACTAGSAPPNDDGLIDVDVPGGARKAEACERGPAQPYCSEVELAAEVRIVDPLPEARPVKGPAVTVTPDGRVRYAVRLLVRDDTAASIMRQYGFAFEGWKVEESTPRSFVATRRLDVGRYVATIRLTSAGGALEWFVDAEVVTTAAVV